jgi:membrane protein
MYFKKFFKELKRQCEEDRIGERAAALSFYILLALIPTLFFFAIITGMFFNEDAVRVSAVSFLNENLNTQSAELFASIFQNLSELRGKSLASVISIAIMLIVVANLSVQVRRAFISTFDLEIGKGEKFADTIMVRITSMAWVMLILILLALLLLIQLGLSLAFIVVRDAVLGTTSPLLLQLLSSMVTLFGSLAFFYVLYRIVSRGTVKTKPLLNGAWVAAILFTVVNTLFSLFISLSTTFAAYGIAGSLVAFILWVYYLMQIVLLGAEVAKLSTKKRFRALSSLIPESPFKENSRHDN